MTEPTVPDPQRARFAPHAAREMAGMFDHVSARYDWLNRLMTFGQDATWRAAMARAVPAGARVVLDLCTGSGASAAHLRQPGRTVLGIDVSFGMLREADAEHGGAGWAPRFVCADGFRLPLRAGAVDAVTIAFGIRNLRPREAALAEIARVLKPGGALIVLEAAAPAPGPLAPFARTWIRYGIPALGRLSPDPSAYDYLSRSIFEFGSGPEFESALRGAAFAFEHDRSFMLGATRLWVARSGGSIAVVGPETVQDARSTRASAAPVGVRSHSPEVANRAWEWLNAGVALALFAGLVWGTVAFGKWAPVLPLERWERAATWWLLAAGIVAFGIRVILLTRRAAGSSRAR